MRASATTRPDERCGSLAREPLDLEAVADSGGTARHVNLMDPHGGRISYLIANGSDNLPFDEAAVAASMARSDVVVVDLAPWTPRVLPLAQASGRPVWTDVHDHDGRSEWHQTFVEAGDVVFVSAQRLSDPREFLRSVVDAGASAAVCTMGAKGSIALDREGRWFEQPAVPDVEVVDANGLGDAFFSGTLFGVLVGETLGEALRYGARASALSLQSPELASDQLSAETVRAEPG